MQKRFIFFAHDRLLFFSFFEQQPSCCYLTAFGINCGIVVQVLYRYTTLYIPIVTAIKSAHFGLSSDTNWLHR